MRRSLWDRLRAGKPGAASVGDCGTAIRLDSLLDGSCLDRPPDALQGGSVLILTNSPITAAAALVELDGVARRLVICPPDMALEHLPAVAAKAAATAIVTDYDDESDADIAGVAPIVRCAPAPAPLDRQPARTRPTEWVLFTSGTTGIPKLVVHTLASLTGGIVPGGPWDALPVWGTFYDIRRYGGLQILLRALIEGASLVLPGPAEPAGDFLQRAGRQGVTHISGTPSHWRRVLMSPAAGAIAPRYIRLSGEIADQPILDSLRAFYGEARLVHAFASTEAGVAFEVTDGRAGFPVSLLDRKGVSVEMKVEDDSLRIRSPRTADRYLGSGDVLIDEDGYVDTGDLVERHDDRYYFIGRRGGIINVGGLKVHPEEVEAVINTHPRVQMSRVRSRKNAITGALVVAEIMARPAAGSGDPSATGSELEAEILALCRRALPPHKVPAMIRLVSSLDVGASGKLMRSNA